MKRILAVTLLGNPVLKKKAKKITTLNNEVKDFIGDMMTTLKHYDGMGVSAPQLNRSLQIIIIASAPSKNYPDAPTMDPEVMINPQIKILNKEMKKDWEGCMSVPGIRAQISRHKELQVEYEVSDGTKKKKSFKDFIARIIQHEIDHLEGLTFVDRIESGQEVMSEQEYQMMMKKKSENKVEKLSKK